MSSQPESQKVRKPAVAGSFYPATEKEIRTQSAGWFRPAPDGPAPQALIVPHAGYVFSGEVAAAAISRIPPGHAYKRIFLLGPSHRVGFAGASVDTFYAAAQTPLGQVPIDVALGEELIRAGAGTFLCRRDAHDGEHCLEVQLPLLQMHLGELPPIVPIVIGTQRLNILEQIADVLEPYFNGENLFIVSSDFSHYPAYEDAKKSDLFLAEAITSGGLEGQFDGHRVTITKEGRIQKFQQTIPTRSFAVENAYAIGQEVMYVTERCVFTLTEDGLELTEIAEGVDLQRDILDQMPFRPKIAPQLKTMEF